MSKPARHIPEDGIKATAQQPVQDENPPADNDRNSLSDGAESAPQLPGDDIEAAAQQPVQDKNPPADGDKLSYSDELPELTYEQLLYKFIFSWRSMSKLWRRIRQLRKTSDTLKTFCIVTVSACSLQW